MAAQVIAAAAEMESANTSMRVSRAMDARAERGEPAGGPRPFGYRRDGGTLVIDEAEAAIIRECAERVLAGETVGTILRDLQARDVRTSTGGRWRRRSFVKALTAARIAGLRQHNGHTTPGTWEPIVTVDVLEALRSTLAPSTARRPAARTFYLSGGIARCDRCGARMKGRSWSTPERGSRRQYHCPSGTEQRGCGGTAIDADALEGFIAGIVIARLASQRFRRRLEAAADDPGIDGLHRRMRALEGTADQIAEAFGAGELDRRAYRLATERNAAERDVLERELRARAGARTTILEGTPTTETALLRWWDEATVEQRHALTAAVIDEVKVGPAHLRRKFDPERLEIVWR